VAWLDIADGVNKTVRDVFADAVSYRSVAGVTTALSGVFSHTYEEVLPDQGASVVSAKPNLWLRLADLPAPPAEGDRFTVRGVTYGVEEPPQIDGTGGATLIGKRVS
jgi:hypothetical protein